jgi:hypothetical protein
MRAAAKYHEKGIRNGRWNGLLAALSHWRARIVWPNWVETQAKKCESVVKVPDFKHNGKVQRK